MRFGCALDHSATAVPVISHNWHIPVKLLLCAFDLLGNLPGPGSYQHDFCLNLGFSLNFVAYNNYWNCRHCILNLIVSLESAGTTAPWGGLPETIKPQRWSLLCQPNWMYLCERAREKPQRVTRLTAHQSREPPPGHISSGERINEGSHLPRARLPQRPRLNVSNQQPRYVLWTPGQPFGLTTTTNQRQQPPTAQRNEQGVVIVRTDKLVVSLVNGFMSKIALYSVCL